ncbi:MAG: KH domain-containing protein [Candidatus Freyarchaeota archaeon]|nr:KH domain-containing protein [Candidatus Freyrarchaeum guaymaensis]HDO80132.1 RNA-processing protein [Candidatus Bathyarchaeota archaeon]
MEAREYIKVPKERIGVIVGKKGEVKRRVEQETKTKITIDSKDGVVSIEATDETDDPLAVWRARDIIIAMARGFSPERAMRLLDEEQMLEVIDLTRIIGRSRNTLIRVKGRIIGEEGKARRIIEETCGAVISVYGHTVSIIGDIDQLQCAKKAIMMLIHGARHSTVYKTIQKIARSIKMRKIIPRPF